MTRIAVLARAHAIRTVRERALALAMTGEERDRVQKLLHEPTLQLRDGVRLNVEKIMDGIECDLAVLRNQGP